jgi:thioredoxin 1
LESNRQRLGREPAASIRTPGAAALIAAACFALSALVMLPACGPGKHGRDKAIHWVRAAYDSTFARDVTGPRRPTVVYYWSNGCIPCMWYGPHIERAARRYAGRIAFWKLEMGWSARRVQLYGVPAVPTLVFYLGDRELDRMQGAPSPRTDDSVTVFLDRGLKLAAAAADSLTRR